MKNVKEIFILSLLLLFSACSNLNDFDNIIEREFDKCSKQSSNCVLDLSNIMNFEWDTMYYFSRANSLEEINEYISFNYEQFVDIGDRVIFLKNKKVVYHQDWFPNPSDEPVGVIFDTDLKVFKVDKSNAKFKAEKKGNLLYLKKL